MPRARLSGMPAFSVLAVGQALSNLGSDMTAFAITIWAWQLTGEATALALVAFYTFLPRMLASPFAGALVDRLDRKLVMALSDLAAGLVTVGLLALHLAGSLEIWHLYVAGAISGTFGAFQFPAFSAAISAMLPKEQYARASGMLSLAGTAPGIAAPMLAGVLLALVGFAGILVFDIVTFVLAVLSLTLLQVPGRSGSARGVSFWGDAAYGFRYIVANRSLFSLQLVFFLFNLVAVVGFTVQNPMILARTGNDELVLGSVQSMGAIGGVAGGLLLSLWGGPRRKIHMLLGGMILIGVFGQVLLGVGREVIAWSLAAFSIGGLSIITNGANQAIWQSKVDPDFQGRVFAARAMIAQVATPVAMLLAGPLADRVLEPGMMPTGALAPLFGHLVGVGPGAGMALILFLAGCLAGTVALVAYALPFVRDVETVVADYVATTATD